VRLSRREDALGGTEVDERRQHSARQRLVAPDPGRQLAVAPRPRPALAVAEVRVLEQPSPHHQSADVAPTILDALAPLKDDDGDASRGEAKGGEIPGGARPDDNDGVGGDISGGGRGRRRGGGVGQAESAPKEVGATLRRDACPRRDGLGAAVAAPAPTSPAAAPGRAVAPHEPGFG